jgi:hypothetical protein
MIYSASGIVPEASAFSILSRVLGMDGNVLTQSGVTAIEYQIFPLDSTTAHVTATPLTVADVIFDTLQTDPAWTKDATGYNFRHDIAETVLTDPASDYSVEYKFTLASAGAPVIRLHPFRISISSLKSV